MAARIPLPAPPSARPLLVGMVHLVPLPGSPGWSGSMAAVLERALLDTERLEQAGFSAVMVENFGDVPFFGDTVPSETVAAMARVVAEVADSTRMAVGVNVLRNDSRAAIGIAAATGARFIRANVHTGAMWTDQGLITGRAAETLRFRSTIASDVAILADVHVKHAVPPAGASLAQSASDVWHRGLADALIVTGNGTGTSTAIADIRTMREAVPDAPIVVGSGVTEETVHEMLGLVQAVIVGTSIMQDRRPGAGIDAELAGRFVDAAVEGHG